MIFRLGRPDRIAGRSEHPSTSEILPLAMPRPGEAPSWRRAEAVMVSGENPTDARATYQTPSPSSAFLAIRFHRCAAFLRCDQEQSQALRHRPRQQGDQRPVIRDAICGGGRHQRQFTIQSAQDLALPLRAGAPAPLNIEERSVWPRFGADPIRAGLYAAIRLRPGRDLRRCWLTAPSAFRRYRADST
jgi:preprotein translocase subunit SecD